MIVVRVDIVFASSVLFRLGWWRDVYGIPIDVQGFLWSVVELTWRDVIHTVRVSQRRVRACVTSDSESTTSTMTSIRQRISFKFVSDSEEPEERVVMDEQGSLERLLSSAFFKQP